MKLLETAEVAAIERDGREEMENRNRSRGIGIDVYRAIDARRERNRRRTERVEQKIKHWMDHLAEQRASISSMKIVEGAKCLAISNRRRTSFLHAASRASVVVRRQQAVSNLRLSSVLGSKRRG